VLCFHGEDETIVDARDGIGAELLRLGAGFFLAGQRGAGPSTGQQTFPALLSDAELALAAAKVRPSELVVFGRSLGSLAAIELASRHRLRGLIIESGVADVGEIIRAAVTPAALGVPAEVLAQALRERYDHRRKLARHKAPILVLASGQDEKIDRSHAARLLVWAGGDDRELIVFRRGRHAQLLEENRAAYAAALAGFLRRL